MRVESVGAVGRSFAVPEPVLGRAAAGAAAYFAAAIVVLHVLRPDVDPIARVTSEYAVGPFGGVMLSAYFALSLSLAALGSGLARSFGRKGGAGAGIGLLFFAALAVAVAGLFPIDVGASRPITTSGWIHRVAGVSAFTSMSVAPLLIARALRHRPSWRGVARLGAVTGTVGIVGFLAMQAILLERGLGGAGQRVVLTLIVAWIFTTGVRLAAGGSDRPAD